MVYYFILGLAIEVKSGYQLNQRGIEDYEAVLGATMFGYVAMRFGVDNAAIFAAGFGIGVASSLYLMQQMEEPEIEDMPNYSYTPG